MNTHNLLILSDIHLGSDLVHHARPDAPARATAGQRRDAELIALLDWYREHPERGRPWRLVIAGDFVDFVGMSVSPNVRGVRTAPNSIELVTGLGGAADHTVFKLRRVALHHREVFRALGQFIEAGNTLVVVLGNHDVDFHWKPVQDEFVRQLSFHARIERGRIHFAPWFYYEEGRVYVEHGHQYDRYCAHDHVLHPVSPTDPRRSFRTLSDIMLSYVVRPTRGMTESGHETAGLFDYLRFAARLGARGMVGLTHRFVRAVTRLMALWLEHFSEGARRIRAHHERRMAEFALIWDVSLERLRALASLQRPPITRSLVPMLAVVMMDRVLVAGAAFVGLAAALWLSDRWEHALAASALLGFGAAAIGIAWARARLDLDASDELRERAARVAKVFPAAFVVMGHTHLPEVRAVADAATYINLGAWAEDDDPTGTPALPATRTHLVVLYEDTGAVAELKVWDSRLGPRRFLPGYVPPSTATPAT